VSVTNSAVLQANLPTSGFTCPTSHGSGGSCRTYSVPLLTNNVIWQNRSFFIAVGGLGAGNQNQQKVVTLYNSFTTTPAISQSGTGACPTASYWDIGVRGDSGPVPVPGGKTLAPAFSVLSSTAGYAASNTSGNPALISQYCNGSRVPPELGSMGYTVNPGTNETNALPTPVFSLTPSATVDEGNNWINLRWGPLAVTHPVTGATLGNYGIGSSSSAINRIPSSAGDAYGLAPLLDYFGTDRKANNAVDAGAVEFTGTVTPVRTATVSPSPLAFGNWANGTTSNPVFVTVTNTGNTQLTGGTFTIPASRFTRSGGTCGATLNVGANCTVGVVFAPNAVASFNSTLTVAYTGATVTGSPVTLTGAGVATRGTVTISPNPLVITASGLTGTGTVTLTNAAGSASSVAVTNVTVTGGSFIDYFFNLASGANNCTGANLAPGASCTVGVQFTHLFTLPGDHLGTVRFTDTATGSPQSGVLNGHF
jgi:hypothetical protein